jgi:GTPase SAR1 family protein
MEEVKVILLGNASVGKSSMIYRYIIGEFEEDSAATIGTSFYSK